MKVSRRPIRSEYNIYTTRGFTTRGFTTRVFRVKREGVTMCIKSHANVTKLEIVRNLIGMSTIKLLFTK